MQQKLYVILLLSIILTLSSCAIHKEEAFQARSQPATFLDNVVIESGSNQLSLHKKKSLFKPKQEDQNPAFFSEITIDSLVATADTALAGFINRWLGVSYRFGGITRQGIDCSAFTRKLYSKVYHVHLLRTALAQFHASIPIFNTGKLEEGDLVFFKIKSHLISHVGVYLSDGYFVQASTHGVMVSNLNNDYWKRYFYAGGRIKEQNTTAMGLEF